MIRIAFAVGSLSRQFINRSITEYIAAQTSQGMECRFATLHPGLGRGNSSCLRARAQPKAADAVLIVGPEHNRSIPAAMKNLIGAAPVQAERMKRQKNRCRHRIVRRLRRLNSGLHLRQSLQSLGTDVLIAPKMTQGKKP